MCSAQVTLSHQSAGLTAPPWRVVAARARAGYCLDVRFHDGIEGEVDLSGLLLGNDAGVFAPLRDVELFNAVTIEHGAVTWPGGLDLAPDALHAAIQTAGRCAL